METLKQFDSNLDPRKPANSGEQQTGLDNFRHSIFGPPNADSEVVKLLRAKPMSPNEISGMGYPDAQPVRAPQEGETLHYSAEYKPGSKITSLDIGPKYNPEAMLGKLDDGSTVWSHLDDPKWVDDHIGLVRTAVGNGISHGDAHRERLLEDIAKQSKDAIRYTAPHFDFWKHYRISKLELVKGVTFSRSLLSDD